MHQFLKFVLEWNSIYFGQFLCPSSGVIHCTLSNGKWNTDSFRAGSGWNPILILLESCLQTCVTYTIAECTVNNSWWWTEDLSEIYRVSVHNIFEKWYMSYRQLSSSRIRMDPDPAARKLSTNLYDIYHCWVYSELLLMMDRGTVRNM
jgi:hypothetical protein